MRYSEGSTLGRTSGNLVRSENIRKPSKVNLYKVSKGPELEPALEGDLFLVRGEAHLLGALRIWSLGVGEEEGGWENGWEAGGGKGRTHADARGRTYADARPQTHARRRGRRTYARTHASTRMHMHAQARITPTCD